MGSEMCIRDRPDDAKLACHRFWLRENAMGQGGIDLATREGILDPAELTDDIEVKTAVVDDTGDLIVEWANDGQRSVYHAGWLAMWQIIITALTVGFPRRHRGQLTRSVRCHV